MSEHSIQTLCLDNLEKHERLPAGALALLRASVERARVVAVLDGWAAKQRPCPPTPTPRDFGNKCFEVWLDSQHGYCGENPDAARAAAAKAIEDEATDARDRANMNRNSWNEGD